MNLKKTEKYYELLSEILLKLNKPGIVCDILDQALKQFTNSNVIHYKLYEALWDLHEYERAMYALCKFVRLTFNKEKQIEETEKLKK